MKLSQVVLHLHLQVIDWNATTRVLRYYQDINTGFTAFTSSETVTGGGSSASGTVASLGNPEFEPDSGDIMYLEHRRLIVRLVRLKISN